MKDKKDKSDLTPGHEQELFSNLEFTYSRSKEDVWGSLEGLLGEDPDVKKEELKEKAEADKVSDDGAEIIELNAWQPKEKPIKKIAVNRTFMAVAASLALLLCAGLTARFYTTTVHVAPGEFTSHTLPDGSEVHLNAATTIKYHPYWWRMDRAVKLNGEAYFVVAKGKKFTVDAVLGSTEVLGTEFNMYARGDNFTVLCEEGKVRVVSEMVVEGTQKEVTLTQGEMAVLELNKLAKQGSSEAKLTSQGMVSRTEILSWRSGQFIYNTTPLSKVFQDLERQYNMTIDLANAKIAEEPYTGGFSRNTEFEQVLIVVCATSELSYEKTGERTYLIKNQ